MSKQMSASAEKRVLDLARKGGILRPRDLQTKGMQKDYLGGQLRDQWHENLNLVRRNRIRSHHIASCYDVARGD